MENEKERYIQHLKQLINTKYLLVKKEIPELQKLILELDRLSTEKNNEVIFNRINQEKIKKALFYIENMTPEKIEDVKKLDTKNSDLKDTILKDLKKLYKMSEDENNKIASNNSKKNLDALFMALKNLKGIIYE